MKSGQTFCFGYPPCCSGESVSTTDARPGSTETGVLPEGQLWNALLGGRLPQRETGRLLKFVVVMACWNSFKFIQLSLARWDAESMRELRLGVPGRATQT